MVNDKRINKALKKIEEKNPIVHCITNIVTVTDCANALLAVGASPTMAHAKEETAEVQAGAAALVLNLGATESFDAMIPALKSAKIYGHPVIVDPVGIGGSSFRREFLKKIIGEWNSESILKELKQDCADIPDRKGSQKNKTTASADSEYKSPAMVIRGNHMEIAALVFDKATATGVDEPTEFGEKENPTLEKKAKEFALNNNLIIIMSGKKDYLTDGKIEYESFSGDPFLKRITGTGCMSSALLGAFLALTDDETSLIDRAALCIEMVGRCGKLASDITHAELGGTMTFHQNFIDELSKYSQENHKLSE